MSDEAKWYVVHTYGYTHIYDIGSLVDWPYGLEY